MHDSLGHRLTLLTLYTGGLLNTGKSDAETLRLLHTTSRSAVDELRQILDILRDETPNDPRRTSLASAEELVTEARSAGAHIELTRDGEPVELPATVEQAAYRTLQEGVTNALRHAQGGQIRLALRYEEGTVIAEVTNRPGRPYDGTTGGQGLYGLAERVRLVGGVLHHGPEPDGGFRIAATLPVATATPKNHDQRPVEPAHADDVSNALLRADQRRRTLVGVIMGGVLALGLLCAGGAVMFFQHITVGQDTYDSVHVGDSEATVRQRLPDPEWARTPTDPACTTYNAEPDLHNNRAPGGYRFCFRDGALISKEPIEHAG